VIGRADDGDLGLFLVEQFAVVAVLLRRRTCQLLDLRGRVVQHPLVDVAQGDDPRLAGGDRFAQDVHTPPARAIRAVRYCLPDLGCSAAPTIAGAPRSSRRRSSAGKNVGSDHGVFLIQGWQ